MPEGAGIGINYFGNALIPSQRQSGYGGVIGGKYLCRGVNILAECTSVYFFCLRRSVADASWLGGDRR